jgi:hypothetical protein
MAFKNLKADIEAEFAGYAASATFDGLDVEEFQGLSVVNGCELGIREYDTVTEAREITGAQGGKATLAKHGREHFVKLAKVLGVKRRMAACRRK